MKNRLNNIKTTIPVVYPLISVTDKLQVKFEYFNGKKLHFLFQSKTKYTFVYCEEGAYDG